jgi:hypothetical protein
MAANALVLPPNQVPIVERDFLVTPPWRSSLQNALNNLQAQITALAALEGDSTALETALAALQAEVDAAEASIAAHVADTGNPHSTTAAQVGADPTGTAATAVAAHEAALDPHPQYLTEAEGDAAYDALGAAAAAQAASQPLDATLTALAGANWALNALPIGTGADTVSQVAFAANTFPARASTGDLVAKTITDGSLSVLAGSAGTGVVMRGDGTATNTLVTSGSAQDWILESYGSLPRFTAKRANGTSGAPTAVTNGQNLFIFSMQGYDGGGFFESGSIQFVSTENWASGTNRGTQCIVRTTTNGTTSPVTRWVFANNGDLFPNADNTYTIGTATFRVKEYFGAIGAINTSDAREKTDVRPFTESEIAAARDLAESVGFFQFLASREIKGEWARDHCGLTVQGAIKIMESHGLDPFNYGFICFDQWDEQKEVRGEEGNVETPYKPAGDRYSFRPDQLDRFIAKGLHERLKALEVNVDKVTPT